MNVGSLSSAAFTALNGLGNVVQQVEQVATNVAAGVSDQPGGSFSEGLSDIVKLPLLEQQARANMQVFNTAEEMLQQLASMPRH